MWRLPVRPRWPRGAWPGIVCSLVAAVFWGLYASAPEGVEGDFYWHLKAGELMLAGQRPFLKDPFSWTASGSPWHAHEWLGEVALFLVYRAGGLSGVEWVYLGLMWCLFGLVWGVFHTARCQPAVGAFGALAIGLHLYAQLWPRMQVFTLIGAAVTSWLLTRWWEGKATGWYLVVYPLVVALWANLHGGAIVGPAACTIALLAAAVDKRRESSSKWPLAGMTLLAWIALLLNPRGAGLVAFVLAPLTDPQYRALYALVAEWGPFRWDYSTCQVFALWWLLVGVVAWLGGRGARGQVTLGMVVLAVCWALMAVVSRRHMPLAAIFSAPMVATLAAATWANWHDRAGSGRRIARLGWVLAVALVIGPTADLITAKGRFETGLRWPSERAVKAVLRYAPGHRLFNLYDWGGLLIYRGYPHLRVFIDGRQDVYGLGRQLQHNQLVGALGDWTRLLTELGVDRVFVPPDVPLADALRRLGTWETAFVDPSAVLFLKKRF